MADNSDTLVSRARTDGEALGRLYEQYYDRIYRYCLHRLYARPVAEDVTSTVFLHVAERIGSFRGTTDGQFRNWLYAIATNQINSYVRKSKRRERLLRTAVSNGTLDPDRVQDDGGNHDWSALHAAIIGLKPKSQALIALRFFEGLPTEQIASILGSKPVTVRVGLSRAIQTLRTRLAAPGGGNGSGR